MKIKIALDNGGGELSAETVEVADSQEMIDAVCQDVIRTWTLSAGDTITIKEV